ncbi:MAG: hypothetical protein ACREBC_17900 [Pyrinomonadaceae bacterium]
MSQFIDSASSLGCDAQNLEHVYHCLRLNLRFLVVLVLLVPGCSISGTETISWVEEVKLYDGEIIRLKRTSIADRQYGIGMRGAIHKWTLEPEGQPNLAWEGLGNTKPTIFEKYQGTYYLVALLAGCRECRHYGFPTQGAIFLRYRNGWHPIQYEELPAELDNNLLASAWGNDRKDDVTGYVSLAEKKQRDRYAHVRPEARHLREWLKLDAARVCNEQCPRAAK